MEIKQAILAFYNLTSTNLLNQGMEAEVYAYGTDHVLKLYSRTASLERLRILQTFYKELERGALSYTLPQILEIHDHGEYIAVVEPRLPGHPLADIITGSAPNHIQIFFSTYVAATLELGQISMPPATSRYKLFDEANLSERATGDWHAFLRRWLDAKLHTLAPFFERDVRDFPAKLRRMQALLDEPYIGAYRLIHGDIFPGNLLGVDGGRWTVDDTSNRLPSTVHRPINISALLDFGLFTMYGDPLWDAATAWVFFDMYDELGVNARAQLLPVFLDQLGQDARERLYMYVLLYSLLSANTYAADCSDGHYEWCVANLNTQEYWRDQLFFL